MTHDQPTPTRTSDPLVSTPPPVGHLTAPAPHGGRPAGADGRTWPDVPGFRVEELLGRGGMGEVYRARQLALGRDVAIKMIAGGGSGAADALRREGAAMALDVPGVARVFDLGAFAGTPFLVMEYCPNGSLADRIEGGRTVSPPVAAGWVAAVARVVAAVHRHGVLHRDLKPANILLAADDSPRVADFGIAKGLGGTAIHTASGAIKGTPAYMAPEQVRGDAGPRSDVYSAGAVLFALLTGRAPFVGAHVYEVLDKVVNEPPRAPAELNPAVPRALSDICLRCLHKNPDRRPPDAATLAAELEAWLAPPPAAPARPRRAALGATVRVLVVALAAAVGAALGAFGGVRVGPEVTKAADRAPTPTPTPTPPSPVQQKLHDLNARAGRIREQSELVGKYLAARPDALTPNARASLIVYRDLLTDTGGALVVARGELIRGGDVPVPDVPAPLPFHQFAVYVTPLGWDHCLNGKDGLVNFQKDGQYHKAFAAENWPRVAFPGRELIRPGSVRLFVRRPGADPLEVAHLDAAAVEECHQMGATNGYLGHVKGPDGKDTPRSVPHYYETFARRAAHEFAPEFKAILFGSDEEKRFVGSAAHQAAAARYKARVWGEIYDHEYYWELTDVAGHTLTVSHGNAPRWANWHPGMKPILNVTVPDGARNDNGRELKDEELERHLRVPAAERAKPENWADGVVR